MSFNGIKIENGTSALEESKEINILKINFPTTHIHSTYNKIKCNNENQKITTYGTISLKENNIILRRNERNEHYKTQDLAQKPTNKSKDSKLIL